MGGRFSGIKFPEDLILRKSDSIQNVDSYMIFNGNLTVYNTIHITDSINRINFPRMCELISSDPYSNFGLIVYGTAVSINFPFSFLKS